MRQTLLENELFVFALLRLKNVAIVTKRKKYANGENKIASEKSSKI